MEETKINPEASTAKAGPRVAPILRVFPSLTDVAFLAPLLLLFARLDGVKTLLGDGDTGWHIRAGEWMLANGRVPEQDLFSFTKAGEPWFAWEWLADVLMALLHQRFGLAGPVYLGIVLIGLTSLLIFRLCRRYTNNDFISIAAVSFAVVSSSIHWRARPHLFTFLFLAITLHWIDRAYENRKYLWFFPPLVALWTNLHGAFFISIVILGAVGTGLALRELLSAQSGGIGAAWAKSRGHYYAALGCAAASLVNPYGWNLHIHIYRYLTERYHFDNIIEFQSMSFHNPTAMFFETLLGLGLLTVGWSVAQRRFADALLLLGWLHLALLSARNVPIYGFIAAPLVTRFLTEAIAALQKAEVAEWLRKAAGSVEAYAADFTATDRTPRFYLPSIGAAGLLWLLMLGAPPAATKLHSEFDTKLYPAKVLGLLDGKRVFTNDEWGDYLIYKLYPNTKVYVDGRSDFYGAEFSLKYLDVVRAKWNWADVLAQHKIDAILLPVDSPLSSTLKATGQWKAVYDDKVAILFYANGASRNGQPGAQNSPGLWSEANPAGVTRAGYAMQVAGKPNPQL